MVAADLVCLTHAEEEGIRENGGERRRRDKEGMLWSREKVEASTLR